MHERARPDVEHSPELMTVIDLDGVFPRADPVWTTILGYAPEELGGFMATILSFRKIMP